MIFESRRNSPSNSVDLLESKIAKLLDLGGSFNSRIKEFEARRLVALEERGLGEKGEGEDGDGIIGIGGGGRVEGGGGGGGRGRGEEKEKEKEKEEKEKEKEKEKEEGEGEGEVEHLVIDNEVEDLTT